MRRSLVSLVRSAWRNLTNPGQRERELDDEVSSYFDLLVAEKRAAGMDPDRARRAALLEIGGRTQVKEEVRAIRAGHTLRDISRDLVAAARSLLRGRWTVPAVAVTTLAIGIAANTTIFSTVYGVLLRPLTIPRPDQLLAVNTRYTVESGYQIDFAPLSGPELLDYRAHAKEVTGVAAILWQGVNLAPPGGEPVRVTALRGTANLFTVLGVEPRVGRGFRQGDDLPGAPCVVMLSDGLWRDVFGAAPVVDSDIPVEGRPCRMIGVMPPGFVFPTREARLWLPLVVPPEETPTNRNSHGFLGVARRRSGVDQRAVEAELDLLKLRWQRDYPEHYKGHFLVSRPFLEVIVGSSRQSLLVLFGAVALVLIGVCLNLVGLNVARSQSRRRETAVRLALGARRSDVIRQLVFESLIVAAIGGASGWAGAHLLRGTLTALLANRVPRAEAIALDSRAVIFTVAVTLLVGLALGFLSALGASRVESGEALRAAGRAMVGERRALRARAVLVVAQVGLGLALSLTAVWLLKSYLGLQRVELGFDQNQVVTFGLSLPEATHPNRAQLAETANQLVERLRTVPGVTEAGVVTDLPLQSTGASDDFMIENRPPPTSGAPGYNAYYLSVTPGFFGTLRIPLLRGRFLNDADRAGAPLVAVINQAAARRHFAGQEPIGQRIRWFNPSDPWVTIVGVVGDIRSSDLRQPPSPAVYVPYAQETRAVVFDRNVVATVRTAGPPAALESAIRTVVSQTAPGVPLARWRTMSNVVTTALGPAQLNMALMGSFAVVVLVLAGLGIYGLMSHSIAMREREIGLRMALGAQRSEVWAAVVRQGLAISLVGVAVGGFVALGASPLLGQMMFQIRVTDPWSIVGVIGAVLLVAFTACALPAFRAARVQPMEVLKLE